MKIKVDTTEFVVTLVEATQDDLILLRGMFELQMDGDDKMSLNSRYYEGRGYDTRLEIFGDAVLQLAQFAVLAKDDFLNYEALVASGFAEASGLNELLF